MWNIAAEIGSGDAGEFVHINLEHPDEYAQVRAGDPAAQKFTAVFVKDHSAATTVRPTIWPTPIFYEDDSLAFDVLRSSAPIFGFGSYRDHPDVTSY